VATTYHPRKAYFSPNRIQLTGKEIIKECAEDKARALETYEYFKKMVDENPDDDKAKSEMVKALELAHNANNKKVKMLDLMIKLAMHQDKTSPKDASNTPVENLTFDEIKALKG
jgi:hypothetical protein